MSKLNFTTDKCNTAWPAPQLQVIHTLQPAVNLLVETETIVCGSSLYLTQSYQHIYYRHLVVMFVVESDKHHVYWHANSLLVVTHELHYLLIMVPTYKQHS